MLTTRWHAILFGWLVMIHAEPLSGASAVESPNDRPNILIIVSDDQGWNDIGYHGSEIATPNLDRLATSGVRLESHYVFPVCSPTRAGLLTGRNPSRFGILTPIGGRSEQALPLETLTLPRLLKDRGYVTAITGKWHLGLRPEVGPRKYGFDLSYGYLHGQVDPFTHFYKNGDRTWHRNDEFVEQEGHVTDLLAAEAIRFIETQRTQPFFLYVPFSVPHTPLEEDDEWTRPYAKRIAEPSRRLFAASLTHMDACIGRIVAALDDTGQRRNTLILFTSDNGGQQDGGDSWKNDYGGKFPATPALGDNRPLRGWKGELYDGGIRVPAFVNWPGRLDARIVHEPVCVLDWLPTIARLVAYDITPELRLEGQDAWPTLMGKPAPDTRTFYWKTPKQSAVRVGDWKLIESGRAKPTYELFDLADDPFEKTDLAADQPQRVEMLRGALRQQQAGDPRQAKDSG